jgi:hypothetical protein
MDRVSLNGTPVETSAPILHGDTDANPTTPVADVPAAPLQDNSDAPEGVPESLRAQADAKGEQGPKQQQPQDGQRDAVHRPALPTGDRGQQQQQQQQQQHEQAGDPSVPAVSRPALSGIHPTAATTTTTSTSSSTTEHPDGADGGTTSEHQQQQRHESYNNQLFDDNQSRSVYFLSSGVDPPTTSLSSSSSTTTAGSHQQHQVVGQAGGKPVEHQDKLPPSTKPEAYDLAQSASDTKSAASQSFDTPLSSTAAPPPSSNTIGRPTDRVVVIQTINGTAYLHSGQLTSSSLQSFMRQHTRPLYANWSDYHQLMLHARQPQQSSVIYHSNIDPVRRYSPIYKTSNYSTNNATPITNDLDSKQQQQQPEPSSTNNVATSRPTTTTEAGPDPELKVIKDQHSAVFRRLSSTVGPNNQNSEQQTISTTSTASVFASTEPPTTTTAVATTTAATTTTTAPPTTKAVADYETTTSRPTSFSFVQSSDDGSAATATSAAQEQAGDSSAASIGGIASFLGSLFDSFMVSSGDAGSQNEARVSAAESGGSNNNNNVQQNDKRLGLDLSFRQQNEMTPGDYVNQTQFANQDGENLMTSDGSQEAAGQQLARCNGYCSLEQFLHLCDSYYSSSDCGRSQRCCVTSASSLAAGVDQSAAAAVASNQANANKPSPSQNQICRGTCLPIYHSGLCMKPNEIHLDAPNCLPNQLCCSQPSAIMEGSNHLEDMAGTEAESASSSMLAHQSANTSPPGPGVSDGSLNKDHSSLSAALVPPPPPPLIMGPNGGGVIDTAAQQLVPSTTAGRYAQTNLGHGLNAYQLSQAGLGNIQQHQHQFQATPRPTQTGNTKSNNAQSQSQTGVGIMNQLFQMFKSNTGLSKQRTRQQQTASSSSASSPAPVSQQPQQLVYEPQQVYHRQIVTNSFSQPPPNQLLAATGPNLGQTIASASNQQLSFAALQAHQAAVAAGNGPAGPIMITPSGQPFMAATMPIPQSVANYQATLGGNGQNRNKQQQMAIQGIAINNGQPAADQAYQYGADPLQYASTLQKQYTPQQAPPSNKQQQVAQQLAVGQLQMHSPPFVLATSEQQQKVAMMNQMNYKNQHRMQQQQQQQNNNWPNVQPAPQVGQQPLAPVASSQAFPQHVAGYHHQQQPSRWTYTAHLSPVDSAPPAANAPQQQQQQQSVSHRQQQQQQQHNGNKQIQYHSNNNGGSMSFGPADAASQSNQPNFKPLVGGGGSQQYGWTGTSAFGQEQSVSSMGNADPLQQSQQHNKRLEPSKQDNRFQSVVASRPHTPEADADIVSAMANAQKVSPSADDESLAHKSSTRFGPQQQQQPTTSTTTKSGYLPKIIPTSTTTTSTTTTSTTPTLPPVRSVEHHHHQSGLSLSSSNLSPIHAATDDDGATLMSGADSAVDDAVDSQPSSLSTPTTTADDESPVTGQLASVSPGVVFGQDHARPGPSAASGETGSLPADPTPSVDDDDNNDSAGPADPLDGHLASVSAPSVSTSQNNMLTDGTSSTVAVVDQEQQSHEGLSGSSLPSKVLTTACGIPGPSRLDLRANSVAAGRARSARVMGGFESEPGYWCWQAALMNGKNEYLCGGALIGTKWVLTAAHCVTQHLRSESQLYVRLGQSNLNTTSLAERRAARNVLVKTSYVHHNHNGITLDNDIALLRLADSVDLSEPNICTVCLPERTPGKQLEPGRRCTVTGYGYETEEGPAALRVRQVDLPLVADQECQTKVGATLQKPFVLPASSFCAGGEPGQDACHGDGGSPLSCMVDGYYVLEGLVSWGYGCGKTSGLFAKVSNFVGWINQIVSVNS